MCSQRWRHVVAGPAGGAQKFCGDIWAGKSHTPYFFIRDHYSPSHAYRDVVVALEKHPCRTQDEENASFVLVFTSLSSPKFRGLTAALPPRPPGRPYLAWSQSFQVKGDDCFTDVWSLGQCSGPSNSGAHCGKTCLWCDPAIVKRRDLLFVSFDLRDYMLGSTRFASFAEPMPGVTMAPPHFFKGKPSRPEISPQFFLTFRGRENLGNDGNLLRRHLKSNFRSKRTDISVTIVEHEAVFPSKPSYEELMDTAYALVPGGQSRWTYRFSEAVGACAIPVVMADGLTLPFEDLIDWSQIALVREEALARSASRKLIESLPTNMTEIWLKRSHLCMINDLYFRTMEKRAVAMLKSAAGYLRNNGGERPQFKCARYSHVHRCA